MAVMMAKIYTLYKIDNKIYNKLHNKIYNIKVRYDMTIRKLVGTLENKGPYIDASTGHWFYWNGTRYVDSGYPYAVKPIISFKIEDGILYYSITWEAQ